MDIWKTTISAGNEAYRLNRFDEAQAHYLSACRCAQEVLAGQALTQDALVALAVSFQNLAELHFQRSQCEEAFAAYDDLSSRLIDLRSRCADLEIGHAIDGIARRSAIDLMHAMKVRNLQSELAQDVLRRFSRSIPS
jgi:GTP cyclohydrolase FolE2